MTLDWLELEKGPKATRFFRGSNCGELDTEKFAVFGVPQIFLGFETTETRTISNRCAATIEFLSHIDDRSSRLVNSPD